MNPDEIRDRIYGIHAVAGKLYDDLINAEVSQHLSQGDLERTDQHLKTLQETLQNLSSNIAEIKRILETVYNVNIDAWRVAILL